MNYEIFQIVAVLENQMPKHAGLVLHQILLHTGSNLHQLPRLCSRGMGALRSDSGAPRARSTIAKKILVTHQCEKIWFYSHDVINRPYIRPYVRPSVRPFM